MVLNTRYKVQGESRCVLLLEFFDIRRTPFGKDNSDLELMFF